MAGGWADHRHGTSSTPEHRTWAAAVLQRAGYRCEIGGPRCIAVATEADHIIPDSAGGPLTLENGQATCTPCHAQKTAAEGNQARWTRRTERHPTETHPGLR
ncbi:MAG: HNH endonuclease [Actinobacteria bacterium]|nr:HNH endonuclease [Actinomycetota bacterium]